MSSIIAELIRIADSALDALRVATSELAEIKRRLHDHPEIDTSATDRVLQEHSEE